MTARKQLLVVTDLDGSLLDDAYAWQAATPALRRLKEGNIPLVLNSSKTLAEMQDLAADLELSSPIVAENGGLLAVPTHSGFDYDAAAEQSGIYSVQMTGLSRDFILATAHGLRDAEGYRFSGFSDWSIDQVCQHTGLSPAAASRAKSRFATEPILWEDRPQRRDAFEQSLADAGIRVLKGGRFLHLMGPADKAYGSQAALGLYQKLRPEVEWLVVALGDSQNDCGMLEAADIAVVIPHADGPHIFPDAPRVLYASSPATAGWNAVMSTILDEYA